MMRRSIVWATGLPALFAFALALGWQTASAAGVVTDCSNDTDFSEKLTGGGLVSFACGPATIVLASTKSITQNTVIEGGGIITLSGDFIRQLLVVNAGAALTLSRITIAYGRNNIGSGGAILNSGSLLITASKVISSEARFIGGAIWSGGPLNVINSEFAYNRSSESGGGAIASHGVLNVINSEFSHNRAQDGGGLFAANMATLTNATFSGNLAFRNGGGLVVGSMATLTNSTFSGNTAAGSGGGIFNDLDAKATLNNSIVNSNTAGNGGGLHNEGTLTLTNSIVNADTAYFGGGLSNCSGAVAILNRSSVTGNTANNSGGGIYNKYGTLTVTSSTLYSNTAFSGGGIFNGEDFFIPDNCTIASNTGLNTGGGVFNYGAATLINSTISGNSAIGSGGGIYQYLLAQAFLRNVTVSNNSAVAGGGLYVANTSSAVLTSTVFAYSPSGGNCYGAVTSDKYSLSNDNTCMLTGTGSQNLVDPKLTALGNFGAPTQVHMLKAGSPAIDAVLDDDAPSTDQRGYARPVGSHPDIGAVERQLGDTDLPPQLYLPFIRR